jgi:hypothetical protein
MQFTQPNNQIHLYPPQHDVSCRGDPAPRIDLLKESSVRALICLLSILFPNQGPRPFYFDHRSMWTVSISSMFQTDFQNAADFLSAVDGINTWLVDWASSSERQPELQPAWAKDRGIDTERVQRFADAFRDRLAKPVPFEIPLFGPDGGYFGLRLPSRHALMPPEVPSFQLETLVVEHVVKCVRLQNLLGKILLVQIQDADEEKWGGTAVRLRAGARLRSITVIDGAPIRGDGTSLPVDEEKNA